MHLLIVLIFAFFQLGLHDVNDLALLGVGDAQVCWVDVPHVPYLALLRSNCFPLNLHSSLQVSFVLFGQPLLFVVSRLLEVTQNRNHFLDLWVLLQLVVVGVSFQSHRHVEGIFLTHYLYLSSLCCFKTAPSFSPLVR